MAPLAVSEGRNHYRLSSGILDVLLGPAGSRTQEGVRIELVVSIRKCGLQINGKVAKEV